MAEMLPQMIAPSAMELACKARWGHDKEQADRKARGRDRRGTSIRGSSNEKLLTRERSEFACMGLQLKSYAPVS